MMVSLEIGFSFKHALDDVRSLELPDTSTVREAIAALAEHHPVVADRLVTEDGRVRRHIHALVNGGNVQHRHGLDTVLQEGDRLTLLPAVGGG